MSRTIAHRHMRLQILYMLLTVGLYGIYWFHVTNREMADHLGRDEPVALWTLLLFVPPVTLYSLYKEAALFEAVSGGTTNRWLTFVLWLVFPPANWYIVQMKLNELAGHPAWRRP